MDASDVDASRVNASNVSTAPASTASRQGISRNTDDGKHSSGNHRHNGSIRHDISPYLLRSRRSQRRIPYSKYLFRPVAAALFDADQLSRITFVFFTINYRNAKGSFDKVDVGRRLPTLVGKIDGMGHARSGCDDLRPT
jgi:hypothetical protein